MQNNEEGDLETKFKRGQFVKASELLSVRCLLYVHCTGVQGMMRTVLLDSWGLAYIVISLSDPHSFPLVPIPLPQSPKIEPAYAG